MGIHQFKNEASNFKGAKNDFVQGISSWRLWLKLAINDIHNRYMRTFMGISWVFISFALFVGVKIIIFLPLYPEGTANFFSAYVAIGFFVWMFMNSAIIEGCMVFISAQSWIKGIRIPLTTFVGQAVARNFILSMINLLVILIILAVVKTDIKPVAFVAIPILFLFVLNAFWVSVLFSVIGTRYRDFVHLVQTLMRVMMFLSPIFWTPEQMGDLMKILNLNPLAHYIYLFRDPILHGTVPIVSLYVVIAITVGGFIAAAFAFAYARKRIVFWL